MIWDSVQNDNAGSLFKNEHGRQWPQDLNPCVGSSKWRETVWLVGVPPTAHEAGVLPLLDTQHESRWCISSFSAKDH